MDCPAPESVFPPSGCCWSLEFEFVHCVTVFLFFLGVCSAPPARRHHGSYLAERSAPGVTVNRSAWKTEVSNGAGPARSPSVRFHARLARVRGRRSGSQGLTPPCTRFWPAQAPRGQGRDPASWRNAYCLLTWPPSVSSPHSDAFPK